MVIANNEIEWKGMREDEIGSSFFPMSFSPSDDNDDDDLGVVIIWDKGYVSHPTLI